MHSSCIQAWLLVPQQWNWHKPRPLPPQACMCMYACTHGCVCTSTSCNLWCTKLSSQDFFLFSYYWPFQCWLCLGWGRRGFLWRPDPVPDRQNVSQLGHTTSTVAYPTAIRVLLHHQRVSVLQATCSPRCCTTPGVVFRENQAWSHTGSSHRLG